MKTPFTGFLCFWGDDADKVYEPVIVNKAMFITFTASITYYHDNHSKP